MKQGPPFKQLLSPLHKDIFYIVSLKCALCFCGGENVKSSQKQDFEQNCSLVPFVKVAIIEIIGFFYDRIH